MIPSVISQQVRRGIEDFLRTTFPIHTPFFEGVVDRLLARPEGVFKGPYLSVKLPFAPGAKGGDYFPDVPLGFPPYLHQEQAFDRLRGASAKSTIIATGTGSGKTECFVYPILDHCWQRRGEPGIKAVIIYPMNALANDQAKRLARVIHDNPKLNGKLRVGLYVGDRGKKTKAANKGSMVMTRDSVITNRDTMRLSPPDILLTNYKMLDYLMIRPADFPLWKQNGPETLKYIVVDELHTFDGAQGTDLACLLRRLKARLKTPAEHLCSVGTSATLGGPENAERLRQYAGEVFGQPFDGAAIISESLLQPQEFFGDHLISSSGAPPPEAAGELDPGRYESLEDYVAAQARLWLDLDGGDELDSAWRVRLGSELMSHVFFRNLVVLLGKRLYTIDEVVEELQRAVKELGSGDQAYHTGLITSILALISQALATPGDEGETRPFLDVRLQLWMRELRRLVGDVRPEPNIRFADDLTPEQAGNHLPVVHCRECGATGWLGTMRQQDDKVNPDRQHIYQCFFNYDPTTSFFFPDGQPASEADKEFANFLCGHCLHVTSGTEVAECPACGQADRLVGTFVHKPRLDSGGARDRSSHNCPYCSGQESLTIMGSRAASLISVAISQLFASIFNDDKKLLAFSDSVQDAAHRAGFFGARTYRFNLRAALQQFVLKLDAPVSLADLPAAFVKSRRAEWEDDRFIATFMPPDMAWLDDYEHLVETGKLPDASDLPDLLSRRIGWEIFSEYAFRCRIGRTLEKTGSSVAGIRRELLDQAAASALEVVQNEVGGLQALTQEMLAKFMNGFLTLLKSKGGVFHTALNAYIEQFGGYYVLNKGENQLFMPRFGKRSRTPGFLMMSGGGRKGQRFDHIVPRGTARTWYQDWATRSFGEMNPQAGDFAAALFDPILAALVAVGVLAERSMGDERLWGIRPEALMVHTEVRQCRCQVCGHAVSVAADELDLWADSICWRARCTGRYAVEPERDDYYGRFYATGDIQRIIPAEHTALLGREEREQVERRFVERQHAWDPNLLSCTPTLEMGIDIGDLSSGILCSVPPAQASYLQRIGRTGRRDGNAFNLAVANGRPHDLYFFADPLEMIAGAVEPPGCFLSASAVLARQFTAFCFDNWVETGIDPTALPTKLGKVLNDLGSTNKERLFPHTFLDFIELNRSPLFERFTGMFPDLPDPAADQLRAFVEGGGDQPGIRVTILQGLEEVAEELRSLRQRVRALKLAIKKLEDSPAKDADYQEELDQLEIERSSMASIARHIVEKQTYNFFTDEGLLPNYAFPEAGVQLRSVILRRKKKEDGKGKFAATVFEYERPAVSAIRELAPSNRFYAEGRKVQIDQIDMRLSEEEEWRFCDSCPHMELVTGDAAKAANCPRCGSPMWADEGQVRRLIKMRQVIATTMDRDSRIQDDSDDREPEFFNNQMLIEIDEKEIRSAYRIDSNELPFGFEYIQRARFREVNFGNRSTLGDTVNVAGRPVTRTGFVICRSCGKVEESGPRFRHEEFKHAISCPKRKAGGQAVLLDCIYLYREFGSEAIRILLPVSSFAGADRKLQSFISAIILGLKHKFRGNIDHLQAVVQEEPVPDNESLRKKYLVIYDSVPGGTGYLKELMQSEAEMMDLFERALAVIQRCACRKDSLKDGCYQCVYAYRSNFEMPNISRETAMELLAAILQHRDQLVPIDTVTEINQNTFIESELEAYFIEALHRARYQDAPVQLKKEIVNHKSGWYCRVNDRGYYVEPQVELGESDGAPIATRADFVFYPEKAKDGKPIAVYLDGFFYHADPSGGKSNVGSDMAKRMGLVLGAGHRVWSLTWGDVENQFKGEGGHFEPLLPPGGSKQQKLLRSFDQGTGVVQLGNLNQLDGFSLLVLYLATPTAAAWQASAFVQTLLLLDTQGSTRDALATDLAALLDSSEHWGNTLLPPPEQDIALVGRKAESDDLGRPRLELLVWTDADAVRNKSLDDMHVVCRLDDDPEVAAAKDFKKAWNGFLRLHNLLQFLPDSLFVTTQGLADADYQVLEFARRPGPAPTSAASGDQALEELAELANEGLLEPDLVPVLRLLAAEGVALPPPDLIPSELCGPNGDIIAAAELAWESQRVAFVYLDDKESTQVFAAEGWQVHTVEDLIATPAAFVDELKPGANQ